MRSQRKLDKQLEKLRKVKKRVSELLHEVSVKRGGVKARKGLRIDLPVPTEKGASDTTIPAPESEPKCETNGIFPEGSARTVASKESSTVPHGSENGIEVARAEQIADRTAERVAGFTSRWGRRLLTRIQQEAEDIWAEAQSIRRDQSQ
jgi:hypothetical protein